jgi:N6-adenosine-specific RNA methylase IME4
MQDWPFTGLRPGAYGTILADPPWRFKLRSEKNLTKSPQGQYACMDLPAIAALPVTALCQPNACLVMWATAPMLPQAFTLMTAWGFTYKSAGAWAKQSSTGKSWAFGTGYCYRSATEFFLLGTRGKPKLRSRSIRNLIVAPVREHSRKPDQMHADVEALCPGPYAELFARQTRPGWDCWGNETEKFRELDLAA